MMKDNRPILLLEDDYVDALTIKRAFKELKLQNDLVIAQNGEEALEMLNEGMNPKPGIILLDINMPKMNGIEFLKELKTIKEYKNIPVIILTTSKDPDDKIESFDLGIAGYITKPIDYNKFIETLKIIESYWSLSELPD